MTTPTLRELVRAWEEANLNYAKRPHATTLREIVGYEDAALHRTETLSGVRVNIHNIAAVLRALDAEEKK